ncbi:MAG: peptidylprolyl isomerase [Phycisphaerae bacterium]|nr:peptidylprolyl isomerase [Phycisphaerae bacterium]
MTRERRYNPLLVLCLMTASAVSPCGCDMGGGSAGRSVGDAWEEPAQPTGGQRLDGTESAESGGALSPTGVVLPIATVNGRPIARKQMMDLLIRTHGMDVLGQLIALQVTRQAAEAESISITPADIQVEYDRALEHISSPVPTTSQPKLDDQAREALLTQILLRRGLTREEFKLAMERQAYLRKIAMKRLKVDERMLREQYDIMYGERVQIRHIQLPDWREIGKVQRLLTSGMGFEEVARVHSKNPRTAADGGMLPPFSKDQDDVPPLLRDAAFKLQKGQVSNPIKINSDYHLIEVVERFPKSNVQFEHVKELVRVRLIERLLPDVMARIEQDLIEKSRKQIVITDPALKKQFDERFDLRQRGLSRGD